jgi:hypothetical protein
VGTYRASGLVEILTLKLQEFVGIGLLSLLWAHPRERVYSLFSFILFHVIFYFYVLRGLLFESGNMRRFWPVLTFLLSPRLDLAILKYFNVSPPEKWIL